MARTKVAAKLLTYEQAAALLAVSQETVERYVSAGRLTPVSLPSGRGSSRIQRIREADVAAFIEAHADPA